MSFRIALDLDGTGFDLESGIIGAYRTWHGVTIKRSESWNDMLDQVHFQNWDRIFEWLAQVPNFWVELDPIPGSIGAMHALAATHEVVIATARPASAVDGTLECLKRWGLGGLPVFFGDDKSQADALVYVDDSPDVLKALAKAGHPTIRYRQPWNSGKGVPGTPANDWKDVTRMIADYDEALR